MTISRSPVASSGTAVTTARGAPSSLPPVSVASASSIAANGTCSPPILAKRLSRPTMVMNPSSSMVTTSPVLYQPSWRTASGQIGLVQVAQHDVRPGHPEHAAFARSQDGAGLGIAHFDADALCRASDGPFAQDRARVAQGASGGNVGRDDRTQLRGAVALEGADAELALELVRNRLRQPFRPGRDDLD